MEAEVNLARGLVVVKSAHGQDRERESMNEMDVRYALMFIYLFMIDTFFTTFIVFLSLLYHTVACVFHTVCVIHGNGYTHCFMHTYTKSIPCMSYFFSIHTLIFICS
jgi:hypothetical protein